MISNPHSPLLVGAVASKASARESNLAAAFLEAALFFFALRDGGSIFAFDCAPRSGAPTPQAHATLTTATTVNRFMIPWILIFRSRQIRSAKYSRKATPSVSSPSNLRNQPLHQGCVEAPLSRREVASGL